MEKDYFMRRAILLALKAGTNIGLNPPSGAVLVRDGKLLGEGFQQKQGGSNAIWAAIESTDEGLMGSTLYCTLEPSLNLNNPYQDSVTAIIHAGIKRVIIGCNDPNEEVNGKGIKALQKAGLEVESGILEDDCLILIEKYKYFIHAKIPFIVVMQNGTLDGSISDEMVYSGDVENGKVLERILQLYSDFDSVLLEAETLFKGNRSLNRINAMREDIFRIIIDVSLDYPLDGYLFPKKDPQKTIILCDENLKKEKYNSFINKGLNLISLPIDQNGMLNIFAALKLIFKNYLIPSTIVDGSTLLITELLKLKLVNKLYYLVTPKFSAKTGGNFPSDLQGIDIERIEIIGDRALFIGGPDFK